MANKSAQARTVGMYEEGPLEELPHEPPAAMTVDPVVADIKAVLDGFHPETSPAPKRRRTVAERLEAVREQWRRTRDSLVKRRAILAGQVERLGLSIRDLDEQIEQCTRAMGE